MLALVVDVAPADCRSPEAMDGEVFSHPCVLDPGNPCRDDGFGILSTTNANIAFYCFLKYTLAVFY
ncbi:MAG: hypothetical protein RL563_575 [Pseudomonadota bacterium]